MSRKKRSDAKFSSTPLDMSSMLDMIFILLVFIMLAVSFADTSVLNIELPQAGQSGSSDGKTVEIAIDASGAFWLKNTALTAASLQNQSLAGIFREKTIIVMSDRNAPFQSFVTLSEILKQGNIREMKIGVKKNP